MRQSRRWARWGGRNSRVWNESVGNARGIEEGIEFRAVAGDALSGGSDAREHKGWIETVKREIALMWTDPE
jgi:hypothetical protein